MKLYKVLGKENKAKDGGRLWYWDGSASLSQLSMTGTSKPDNCKFPEEVAEIILTEAIEILSVSKIAQESISSVKIWKK